MIWTGPQALSMMDSAPPRVRASTPLCAPSRVRVLLTAACSLYVPAATLMVSLATAFPMAPLIVLHAVAAPGARQVLASLPVGSTYQLVAHAVPPAKSPVTRTARLSVNLLGFIAILSYRSFVQGMECTWQVISTLRRFGGSFDLISIHAPDSANRGIAPHASVGA